MAARAYRIDTVLVFNKIDSYAIEARAEVLYLKDIYEAIGYRCIEVSATQHTNVSIIKEIMKDKTSMFVGHSGVGKTTLVNAIDATLDLKTKEISDQHQQGKHTTTFAEMFDLNFNARIIDTPGIKGFGVVDIDKYELGDYFPEFFALKQDCKFNNCIHTKEPNCAIKAALEEERISWSRYKSYLQILEGEDEMQKIEITDEILKEKKSIIEDRVVAAHNNAKSELKNKTTEEISKATGGFGIPGFKWPF